MWKGLLEEYHVQVFSYMNLVNFERLYIKISAGTAHKFLIENGR